MPWKQDDLGYFANHNGCSAQIVREGQRWRWRIFHANGARLWQANSRTLDEAKDSATIMLERAP